MIFETRTQEKRLLDQALLELRFAYKPRVLMVGGIKVISSMVYIEESIDWLLERKFRTQKLNDTHEIVLFEQKPINPKNPQTKIYYNVRLQ